MLKRIIKINDSISRIKGGGIKHIFIRGAGNIGRALKCECDEIGISIEAFLDTSLEKQRTGICGIPVYSPDIVKNYVKNDIFVFIALNDRRTFYQAKLDLEQSGLREFVDYVDIGIVRENGLPFGSFMDLPKKNSDRHQLASEAMDLKDNLINSRKTGGEWVCHGTYDIGENMLITSCNLLLTSHCTLNCYQCCQGISIENAPRHFPLNEVIEDFEKFMRGVILHELVLLGGEPFIYPQLKELLLAIPHLKCRDKIMNIKIVTNGTVVPSDRILELLKSNNVFVEVSNYGDGDAFGKRADFLRKMDKIGVHYLTLPDWSWNDLGDFKTYRNHSKEELVQKMAVCAQTIDCGTIRDGKFWICPTMGAYQENGIIPYNENECLDIGAISDEDWPLQLDEYYYGTHSMESCQYCNGIYPNGPTVVCGLQVKRK